jgi:hypothetical protein
VPAWVIVVAGALVARLVVTVATILVFGRRAG